MRADAACPLQMKLTNIEMFRFPICMLTIKWTIKVRTLISSTAIMEITIYLEMKGDAITCYRMKRKMLIIELRVLTRIG